ncbi:MAG: HDOD domain-containing protein [Spirochaetaceae bacterium]|jgi:putative nucleotidyltransferase with HDIG domain|nr:HDOD domain-containing protein [Spirochaetaceae bacterium]GMO29667.1 MAG: ATP-binding protein [Termitinemataceae bacterium]
MTEGIGFVVDEAKIQQSVKTGTPVTITTYTLPHDLEVYMGQVLGVFLKCSGHESLRDYLEYCVQELAINAKKANTKRVYFLEKHLNIEDPDEYREGMINFKKDTLDNMEYYLQIQRDKGFYIKVIYKYEKDSIVIEVRNNVVVSKIELMRIHDKLARSRKYNSLEDAFSQVLDSSEGAGLGLVVLVLMLKKMGLDEECFEISASEMETMAKLRIPLDKTKINNVTDLTNTIVDSVNSLPQFPENIMSVQKLASDPNSEMSAIAKKISIDPAMTADIIKIVNSAQYMLSKKVDSISDAIKILGIKGIRNLLYSYGTQKILGNETKEKKNLWNHSYKTAFYTYNLVRNFGKNKLILDDAYVGGMLHDMGKIVFFSSVNDFSNKIKLFCDQKGIPEVTFEYVSAGMNHAEIGALIAEKWNFPQMLVCGIRFHHDPLAAPVQFRPLVDAIYLANMFCQIEESREGYELLEPTVLAGFGLTSKKQVEIIIQKFSQGFKREVGLR